MGLKSKQGKKGEAVEYYSRKQALRHLQINLPSFIRLCLWKGIHPKEPNCRKIVGKGDTTPKSYYSRKDINLLLHEPLLLILRQIRIHNIKVKKAKEKNDKDKLYRLMKSKPTYSLHHLVKELYPTKEIAISHLDDALVNIFTFAAFPKMTSFRDTLITLCKKQKLEFLNYCITQQALRKCFINVKGYTIGVDILGIPVKWTMPHQHTATVLPGHVDYRLLANKLELDNTLLAVLLKSLYTEAGLSYPPKFESVDGEWTDSDLLASLTSSIVRSQSDHEGRVAHLSKFIDVDDNVGPAIEKEKQAYDIQTLFKGEKVFLNREIPREVFCFIIRCCGGEVSWDKTMGYAAPFDETDDTIKYQIIDRPLDTGKSHLSRFYVQPQFVFDCVNAGRLLPVKDYMPGTTLPAHLSPFVDYTVGYVPPEYKYLKGEISLEQLYKVNSEDEEDEEEAVEEIIYESENEVDDEDEDDEDDEGMIIGEEEVEDIEPLAKKPKIVNVKRKPKEQLMAEIKANKDLKIREAEIPKKQQNLYRKMKYAEKKKVTDVIKMTDKRQAANKSRAANKK